MFGTPASNFRGAGAQVADVIVTVSIMEPPKRNGGRSFSSELHKTPTPVGPTAL